MKKNNFIIFCILFGLVIGIALAAFYPEPWSGDQNGGQNNLTNVDWISANVINGTSLTGEVIGSMNWTKLQNYPSACPGSGAITTLDDTVTCQDLWVDVAGDTMTGNLSVSGNVTADNVFLPAELFTHTNTNTSIVSAGVWYNVTFGSHDDPIKDNINHIYNDNTNMSFTINDAGTYMLSFNSRFTDSDASPTAHVGMKLVQNAVEIPGSYFEKDTTKQNAIGTMHNNVMAELSPGDIIELQVIASATTVTFGDGCTYGSHCANAMINIHRIS